MPRNGAPGSEPHAGAECPVSRAPRAAGTALGARGVLAIAAAAGEQQAEISPRHEQLDGIRPNTRIRQSPAHTKVVTGWS